MRDRLQRSIPARQNAMQLELEQLRDRIRAAGIGRDVEAEDCYLGILHDLKMLDRAYALQEGKMAIAPIPPGLEKALSYGQLLLDV